MGAGVLGAAVVGLLAGVWGANPERDIVVAFDAPPSALLLEGVMQAAGGDGVWRRLRHGGGRAHPLERVRVLRLGAGTDAAQARRAIEQIEGVRYAHPDWIVSASAEPSDPLFSQQCGKQLIDAVGAWDETLGVHEVVVAVCDTGLNFAHEEFAGRIWVNEEEIPGNGLDDDQNGYVDDVFGWDFIHDDAEATDVNGHGTLVAGICAAGLDNGLGVAGMGNLTIMVLQVLGAGGSGSWSAISEAIFYAVDNGADVVNFSGGGFGGDGLLADAVSYAEAHGVIVVGAAGNSGSASPFYPAAYPEVIGVGGVDCADGHYERSNLGINVDLVAPGVGILSTAVGGEQAYGDLTGTSASAPFVAGLVGLMLSVQPDLDVGEVRSMLRATAVDLGEAGDDDVYGGGRVDARRAVASASGVCPGDLDGDGDADGEDFFTYLDAFANQDGAVCDLDGDGACDGGDFFRYLDLFSMGCR